MTQKKQTLQIGIDAGTTNGYIAVCNITTRHLQSVHKLFGKGSIAFSVIELDTLLGSIINPLEGVYEVLIAIERPTTARIVNGKRIANNPLAFTQFIQIQTILALREYNVRVLEPKTWQKQYFFSTKGMSQKERKEQLYNCALQLYPSQKTLINKANADACLLANHL